MAMWADTNSGDSRRCLRRNTEASISHSAAGALTSSSILKLLPNAGDDHQLLPRECQARRPGRRYASPKNGLNRRRLTPSSDSGLRRPRATSISSVQQKRRDCLKVRVGEAQSSIRRRCVPGLPAYDQRDVAVTIASRHVFTVVAICGARFVARYPNRCPISGALD